MLERCLWSCTFFLATVEVRGSNCSLNNVGGWLWLAYYPPPKSRTPKETDAYYLIQRSWAQAEWTDCQEFVFYPGLTSYFMRNK
jgi:hypothetical protein